MTPYHQRRIDGKIRLTIQVSSVKCQEINHFCSIKAVKVTITTEILEQFKAMVKEGQHDVIKNISDIKGTSHPIQ